jgi:hypothetical protein
MIRNLLKPDYRFSHWKAVRKAELKQEKRLYIQQLIGVAFLGFLAGVIFTKSLYDAGHRNVLPTGLREVEKVQEVKADEPRYCGDRLSYIRCAVTDAGLTDKNASTLIRIARAESGCKLNEKATNGSSTASGMFQILYGTWNGNDCQGNAFNYKNATDCAIKIYKLRGTQPWETSAHQKSGNGWADPNQCLWLK